MRLVHYSRVVTDPSRAHHLVEQLTAVRDALDRVRADSPDEAVEHLGRARVALDAALDEAMALAALAGSSLRAVADRAGVSPNTVPPRLARTAALGDYASGDGKVSSAGVERARYDVDRGSYSPAPAAPVPLRFRRRRS
jgi:hypothetical protein